MAVERMARWIFTEPTPNGRRLTVERQDDRWVISMESNSVDFPVELRLEPDDDEYLAMLLLGEDEEWLARYRAGEFKRSNGVRLGVKPGRSPFPVTIEVGDGFYDSGTGLDWKVSKTRANGTVELVVQEGANEERWLTVHASDLGKPPWRHTPKGD